MRKGSIACFIAGVFTLTGPGFAQDPAPTPAPAASASAPATPAKSVFTQGGMDFSFLSTVNVGATLIIPIPAQINIGTLISGRTRCT